MGLWVSRYMQDRGGAGACRKVVRACFLLGSLAVLAACGSSPTLPSGDVASEIFYSSNTFEQSTGDASLRQLNGETIAGSVYVFVKEKPNIEEVAFFLDDPQGSGQPLATFAGEPFGMTLDTAQIANGLHSLTAVVTASRGKLRDTVTAEFTVANDAAVPAPETPGGTPTPWPHQDIGETSSAGSSSTTEDGFAVSASGGDIWGQADSFHFVYQSLSGDGEIVAQVRALGADAAWAKAGVMIRESLEPGSSHVMANLTAGNGAMMTWRAVSGDSSQSTSGSQTAAMQQASAPHWLKLARSGDTFSAYHSSDGQSWEYMGSQTVGMAEQVYVGLALSSHDAGLSAEAEFANITIGGPTDVQPAPEPEPDTDPEPSGADYYVATSGSDSNDGRGVDSAFRTLQRAADAVQPGDTVYVREGVYSVDVILHTSGTEDQPITFASYPGEWAILDGSNYTPYSSNKHVIFDGVSWNVFMNFEVRNAPRQGIYLKNSNHNTVKDVVTHDNYGSGIQIVESSDNLIIGLVAYDNYDSDNPANGLDGDNADGIGVSSGNRNRIVNCHVYHNSDDGVDVWKSIDTVVDGCVSHDNGYGRDGNGNGIKAGGDHVQVNTIVRNSVAYHNRANGFDYNTGQGVSFINNTGYDNGGHNFVAAYATLKNNISVGSRGLDFTASTVTQAANSWNLAISDPMFVSTDPNSGTFLTLAPNSPAVDAGVDVGLPFQGDAPDLGAMELGTTLANR